MHAQPKCTPICWCFIAFHATPTPWQYTRVDRLKDHDDDTTQYKSLVITCHILTRLARRFRQLFVAALVQLLCLVVMRGDFEQPRVLYRYCLPHELLRRKHQFMVDDPPRPVFEETTVRVDHYCLLVLYCFIVAALAEACRVVEKPCCDRLKQTSGASNNLATFRI